MTYAPILLHVNADDEGRPRSDRAADLAKDSDATLIGHGAEMVPLPVSGHGLFVIHDGCFQIVRETLEVNLERARKDVVRLMAGGDGSTLRRPGFWVAGRVRTGRHNPRRPPTAS